MKQDPANRIQEAKTTKMTAPVAGKNNPADRSADRDANKPRDPRSSGGAAVVGGTRRKNKRRRGGRHPSSVNAGGILDRDHRAPHPIVGPSTGFSEYPNRKLSATADHPEHRGTAQEMAQYWYQKSETQNDEIEKLKAEVTKWQLAHDELKDRAEDEYNRGKEKLEGLLESHIKAVNSVGSGLEPVTDQTFTETFKRLRCEVRPNSLQRVTAILILIRRSLGGVAVHL